MEITDNGIVTLRGLSFSEETRMHDAASASGALWAFTRYGGGNAFLSLLSPIQMGDFLFRVEVYFPSEADPPQISLYPLPSDTQAKGYTATEAFQVSREWLKAFMDPNRPAEETDEVVGYDLPWGYLYTMLIPDREYGLRGGVVEIRFERHSV